MSLREINNVRLCLHEISIDIIVVVDKDVVVVVIMIIVTCQTTRVGRVTLQMYSDTVTDYLITFFHANVFLHVEW